MRKSITMTSEQSTAFKIMAAHMDKTQSGLICMMASRLASEIGIDWPEDAKVGNPTFNTEDNPSKVKSRHKQSLMKS